jgi:hypothetical protein
MGYAYCVAVFAMFPFIDFLCAGVWLLWLERAAPADAAGKV